MSRGHRQTALLVGKRGLDDHVPQRGECVDRLDQLRTIRRVARIEQLRVAAVQGICDRGHRVVRWQCGDGTRSQMHRLAHLERLKAQERSMAVGNGGEVWPDQPVEDMRTQDTQGFRGGINRDRITTLLTHRIHQQGNRRDVIEMRMRDEDMIDLAQRIELKIAHTGPAIDQDVVVDEKGGRPRSLAANSAAAAKHLKFHQKFLPGLTSIAPIGLATPLDHAKP